MVSYSLYIWSHTYIDYMAYIHYTKLARLPMIQYELTITCIRHVRHRR